MPVEIEVTLVDPFSGLDADTVDDLESVIEENLATELYPKLSEAGARGLVEYPLNKIVE